MIGSPISLSDSLRIGTIVFVSPNQIDVQLEIEAPGSTALNTGTPRTFPRINGYVLVPCDEGFVVGQVEWLTIENSQYPKRKGMQDFGMIDLPFPLRKMRLNPIGTLYVDKIDLEEDLSHKFKRGVNAFPSVGDPAVLPTDNQLRAIVESGKNRRVKIGTSPLAANATVMIDPDRLFGRHLAVLGNTGSGKSCSVAGLIRWSLEAAQEAVDPKRRPNARFIVLDPNGEYTRAFEDIKGTRFFSVDPGDGIEQLHVPLWFWNSAEWSAFTKAASGVQEPAIHKVLRLRRNVQDAQGEQLKNYDVINYLRGSLATVRNAMDTHIAFSKSDYAKYMGFLDNLEAMSRSFSTLENKFSIDLKPLVNYIDDLLNVKGKNESGYPKAFNYGDIDGLSDLIRTKLEELGGEARLLLEINEDVPIKFSSDEFIADLNFMATNSNNSQWFDSLLMRVNSLLADTRMKSIVEGDTGIDLQEWLSQYVGETHSDDGPLTIIDLSLVPSEIIHIVTAVIARITFEALQRYRKLHPDHTTLPTVIVMEEAHTFIKRYKDDIDNSNAATICCQVFERIAREGRKFGLGLVLSSQRPSELSPTVLSQCNSFLLHRVSNDKDQELVQKLVPDNLKGLLRDLPSLPSQNAVLLGWATEVPTLLRMNDLPLSQQPLSNDPAFWDTWISTSNDDKSIPKWVDIVEDWTKPDSSDLTTSDQPEPDERGVPPVK